MIKEKTTQYQLTVTQRELDILIAGVSQRLMAWAERKIAEYKSRMEDPQGPQHYITGFEEYTKFLEGQHGDEIKLWESLCEQWYVGIQDRPTQDLMRAKESWLKEFQKIQQEYDARLAVGPN